MNAAPSALARAHNVPRILVAALFAFAAAAALRGAATRGIPSDVFAAPLLPPTVFLLTAALAFAILVPAAASRRGTWRAGAR